MRKVFIVAAILFLMICAGGALYWYRLPTPIGKIISDPRDYESKEIRIEGVVTDRVSLAVVRYFSLKDDSGEIIIITDRSLPNIDEHLRVSGHIEQSFAIGELQSVVFVESTTH